MKKIIKTADLLTAVIFLTIIFSMGILLLVLPERGFSEEENRTLAEAPSFSLSSLVSGSFSSEVNAFCSDNLPFRSIFIKTKGIAELALGKGANNEIISGSDGYLLADCSGDFKRFGENVDSLAAIAEQTTVPVSICIIGRSSDVLTDKLPAVHPDMNTDALFASVSGINGYINTLDLLREKKDEYIYYKTDHHLTALGSYYVYREIIGAMNGTPYPLSDFTPVTVSEEFYGSLWSSSGMLPVKPDSVTLYRFKQDENFTVAIADTGKVLNGFYDFSWLEQKDKYGVFLSGVNARVDITENNTETVKSTETDIESNISTEPDKKREKLILIKDSFSHSVAPFLARHYDLILIDLRYYKTSVYKLAEQEGASQILVLCGIDNMLKLNGFFDLLKIR